MKRAGGRPLTHVNVGHLSEPMRIPATFAMTRALVNDASKARLRSSRARDRRVLLRVSPRAFPQADAGTRRRPAMLPRRHVASAVRAGRL